VKLLQAGNNALKERLQAQAKECLRSSRTMHNVHCPQEVRTLVKQFVIANSYTGYATYLSTAGQKAKILKPLTSALGSLSLLQLSRHREICQSEPWYVSRPSLHNIDVPYAYLSQISSQNFLVTSQMFSTDSPQHTLVS